MQLNARQGFYLTGINLGICWILSPIVMHNQFWKVCMEDDSWGVEGTKNWQKLYPQCRESALEERCQTISEIPAIFKLNADIFLTLKIFKVHKCEFSNIFKWWQYKGNRHGIHSNMNAHVFIKPVTSQNPVSLRHDYMTCPK